MPKRFFTTKRPRKRDPEKSTPFWSKNTFSEDSPKCYLGLQNDRKRTPKRPEKDPLFSTFFGHNICIFSEPNKSDNTCFKKVVYFKAADSKVCLPDFQNRHFCALLFFGVRFVLTPPIFSKTLPLNNPSSQNTPPPLLEAGRRWGGWVGRMAGLGM